MALTDAQLESVREIVGSKSFSTIESLCESELNAASEAAMIADTVLWELKKNKTTKLKGGSDGLDIDPGRRRR